MFEIRQKSDYEDLVKFNKEDVTEWLKKTEDFVSEIEKVISNIIEEQK